MLHDVTSVEYRGDGYQLLVRFDDGVEGVVDVRQLVQLSGIFSALRDSSFFAQVNVHPELGVVCWPNGADIDSDVLYGFVTRGVNLAAPTHS